MDHQQVSRTNNQLVQGQLRPYRGDRGQSRITLRDCDANICSTNEHRRGSYPRLCSSSSFQNGVERTIKDALDIINTMGCIPGAKHVLKYWPIEHGPCSFTSKHMPHSAEYRFPLNVLKFRNLTFDRMDNMNESEHVGVSHLAGSLKEQRQNAIKIDVTADVLAERIKVGPFDPTNSLKQGVISRSGVVYSGGRLALHADNLSTGCATIHQDVQCNFRRRRVS